MKKVFGIFFAVALCLSAVNTTAQAAANIKPPKITTIDTTKTYQTIEGFGASYTWYSDWMTNIDDKETGYDWIFTDAEFNILRFRDQHGVKGDEKNVPLEGYKPYKAYYDAAVARGIDPIVLVTSWGQYDRELPFVAFNELSEKGYTYYTLAKDENGEYMYDELAQFCVQSIQYFFDAGIPVHYFSISNEIELQELHKDETGKAREEAGFFFGAEETEDYCAYWKAHLAVYEAFQKAFGDKAPSIIGAETMAGTPSLLNAYLDPLIKEHPEKFDVIAHHLYGTSLSAANFQELQTNFSDYRLWQTEWYCNEYSNLGDVILNELISENLTAFLYWNGVWIEDDGNCLIEISTWEPNAEIKRMPGHYIMMHFSKFIKNGYQRVDVAEDLRSRVGAFISPDSSKLVVVVSNSYVKAEELHLNINREIKSSEVYRSTEHKDTYMEAMGEYEDGMSMPAKTLTTIVFELGDEITSNAEAPETVEPEVTESQTTESQVTESQELEVSEAEAPETQEAASMTDNEPNTNDNSTPLIIGAILAIAVIVIALLLFMKKKKQGK